ncbi:hybrid sensor histidine kinase/response regulator [Melittangium boletus]|uniref:histidine kinase n=1 Tax=Melittangium boletus DSM 14713 TaxID=1294270 RepID=A0A250INU6_9BACT|nr:response regulator [Melittangium boletus]ATB33414.1 hybrid sensor histidine kinase/response regulator [Melittangium boletus DSM 14713]
MRREAESRLIRVLLVEDDEDDFVLTRDCLRELGPRRVVLEWVATCERALEELQSGRHDVCLLDYRLGATTGLELLQRARGAGWRGPFILLTGQEDNTIDHEAQQAGAADFLEKSKLTSTLLERSIRYALQHAHTLEALRRSQESFQELIERLPDGVSVLQEDRLVYINPSYVALLGFSSARELVGKSLAELGSVLLLPEAWDRLHDDIHCWKSKGEPIPPREVLMLRRGGGRTPVEIVHIPLTFDGKPSNVWIVRDLTERKEMEARLLRADRMGSLGLLAAGVAHEINNPLAYTMASLDHLESHVLTRLELSSVRAEAQELLAEIRLGATRVRDIVRQLKMFSRGDEDSGLGPVDVHRVIETSIGMAVNELKHRARLVRDYGPPFRVEANEGRLGQVILNLLVNAAHAIPEGNVERNEVRIATSLQGSFVRIEVHDTGVGIRPENLARVFDPFFTTKPVGVGTGLGLSICHDIVTSFGGRMGVESRVGEGSTFWLLLAQHSAARTQEAPRASVVREHSRRGRVMVVDDEPLIGTAIRRTLQREHEVITLTSAREALTRLVSGEHFDVILCDVMMPEMSGVELYQQLLLHLPVLTDRLVFLTGGAFTPNAREFLSQVKNRRVDKPFSGQDLHDVVQSMLVWASAH